MGRDWQGSRSEEQAKSSRSVVGSENEGKRGRGDEEAVCPARILCPCPVVCSDRFPVVLPLLLPPPRQQLLLLLLLWPLLILLL